MCDWYIPSKGTTDIFSTTIPDKTCWASMPAIQNPPLDPSNPQVGSQLPRTGSRFIGIFAYKTFWNVPEDTTYREYAQVPLTVPLIPGEYYCAEMFVSMADKQRFAINNLGFYFHEIEIRESSYMLNVTPQVLEEKIIDDADNWVKVAGTFQANASHQYVTIGNFFHNYETKALDRGTDPQLYPYNSSYYFIDDVSVLKFQQKQFVYLGSTTICQGELASIEISGGLEDIVCSLLSDTTAIVGHNSYLSVRPLITTSYLVKGKNCGEIVKDTLSVTVKPGKPVDLIPDQTICAGTSLILDAGDGNLTYKWQDGSTGRFFHLSEQGSYNVWVENEYGCKYYDNVNIYIENKPTVKLGDDTVVCDKFFPLYVEDKPNLTYYWSTGSTDHEITPSAPGIYSIRVENACGEATDSIRIYSRDDIFVPNVLTLNDDELNEKFVIDGAGKKELKIYNRWGDEIFQSKAYKDNWPLDNAISSGTYFYTFMYSGCKPSSGWIQIVKN